MRNLNYSPLKNENVFYCCRIKELKGNRSQSARMRFTVVCPVRDGRLNLHCPNISLWQWTAPASRTLNQNFSKLTSRNFPIFAPAFGNVQLTMYNWEYKSAHIAPPSRQRLPPPQSVHCSLLTVHWLWTRWLTNIRRFRPTRTARTTRWSWWIRMGKHGKIIPNPVLEPDKTRTEAHGRR